MNKPKRITLGGLPATGTSSVGRGLANKLGLPFHSGGEFFRALAAERGISPEELTEVAKAEPELDRKIDAMMAGFGKDTPEFVVESRLAWKTIPDSLKILLVCDDEVRFQRISGREAIPVELAKSNALARHDADNMRYLQLYGVAEYVDPAHYDHVINTTSTSIQEIVEQIAELAK